MRTCSASFTSCQAVHKLLDSRSLGLPICRRDNSVLTAQGRLRTESDIVRTRGQMVASRTWTPCGLPAAGCSTLPLCREGLEDGAHKGCGWFQEDSSHPSGGATLARQSPFPDSGAERRHSAGLWWVLDEHAARTPATAVHSSVSASARQLAGPALKAPICSECGPCTRSVTTLRRYFEIQNLRLHVRPTESESAFEQGPQCWRDTPCPRATQPACPRARPPAGSPPAVITPRSRSILTSTQHTPVL